MNQVFDPKKMQSRVNQLRKRGIEAFGRQGFPTTRQEEWRDTNLAVLDVTERGFVVIDLAPGVTFESLQAVTGAELHRPSP